MTSYDPRVKLLRPCWQRDPREDFLCVTEKTQHLRPGTVLAYSRVSAREILSRHEHLDGGDLVFLVLSFDNEEQRQ